MSAIEIASLFATLEAKDNLSDALDGVEQKATGLSDTFKNLGGSVSELGSGMTTLFAPLGLALGASVKGSMDFSAAMTNAGAALGMTKEQIADVSAQVLDLGANSRSGGQAAAEAYYDIAGGVADASTHMDVLKTSLDVAAAGSADLGGVVDALVKTMNIYGMSAEDAARAGDVLTRAVGVGVGTMGEFASALPPVEGLAKSLGISFDDTGGYMAYMSTKAASVAEGGTQLRGVMSKLINPSKELGEAIAAMGYASGASLVEQEGLVGALKKIKDFGGGTFSGLITDQEAMLGAMALTADGAEEFFTNYSNGIDGATQRAKEIQMSSPAAQFDLLKNSMAQLGIEVGDTLVPVLVDLMKSIKPVISGVVDWVKENPELVKQIALIVGGLAIAGPILLAVGAGISAIGAIIGGVVGVIGVILSPIGLIIAAVVALGAAFATNFGGIRDAVQPVIDNVIAGFEYLIKGIGWFIGDVQDVGIGGAIKKAFGEESWVEGVIATFLGASGQSTGAMRELAENITEALGNVVEFVTGTVIPGLQQFANWFLTEGLPAVVGFVQNVVIPAIELFFQTIGNIWSVVGPALQQFANWFLTEGLPAIVDFITGTVIPGLQQFANWFLTEGLPAVVGFVQTVVIPAIESFFQTVGNIWAVVGPALQQFGNWFLTEGLPAIVGFVNGTVVPAIEGFFNFIAGAWEQIRPGLESLFNWFVNEGLPAIASFITETVVPAVENFFNFIAGVWEQVRPALESMFNWFMTEGLPAIQGFITETVQPAVETFFGFLEGVWEMIGPVLSDVYDWFATNLLKIQGWVGEAGTEVGGFVTTLQNIWANVQGPLNELKNGIMGVLEPILGLIDRVIEGFNSMQGMGEIKGQAQSATAGLSDDQLWQSTLNAAGGNDFLARIAFAGARAEGGPVDSNKAYMVGERGPELFVPNNSGSIVPNNAMQNGGGGVNIGTVTIHANSQAEGAAAADGFMRRINEEIMMSGMGG